MSEPILEARGISRSFDEGSRTLNVLNDVDFAVSPGEMVSILGRSGSGKSTLMHLLGGLDTPTSGEVFYRGDSLQQYSERRLDHYRRSSIGFVFQFYHLLPELTALENVLIGSMIGRGIGQWLGVSARERDRAKAALDRLGLGHRLGHRPNKLSGGERQRVAIARSLINEPRLLLCDEPTGNLDADTGRSILELFSQLHAEGQTLVLVTHDDKVAAAADRVVELVAGRVEGGEGSAQQVAALNG